MTQRTLERLAQLAVADTQRSAGAAVQKLAHKRLPDAEPARHGVDIAELLRRLEADAQWSARDDS